MQPDSSTQNRIVKLNRFIILSAGYRRQAQRQMPDFHLPLFKFGTSTKG
jgi:hypothetical protein